MSADVNSAFLDLQPLLSAKSQGRQGCLNNRHRPVTHSKVL